MLRREESWHRHRGEINIYVFIINLILFHILHFMLHIMYLMPVFPILISFRFSNRAFICLLIITKSIF